MKNQYNYKLFALIFYLLTFVSLMLYFKYTPLADMITLKLKEYEKIIDKRIRDVQEENLR